MNMKLEEIIIFFIFSLFILSLLILSGCLQPVGEVVPEDGIVEEETPEKVVEEENITEDIEGVDIPEIIEINESEGDFPLPI